MSTMGGLLKKIFGMQQLQSKEGTGVDKSNGKAYRAKIRNMAISFSREELKRKEDERKEEATYNCLAEMVLKGGFRDTADLKSLKQNVVNGREKANFNYLEQNKLYRRQVEEYYQSLGLGEIDIPVSDEVIRIYREIQRLAIDKEYNYIAGGGMLKVEYTGLKSILQQNNMDLMDLETILKKDGKQIANRIDRAFSKGKYGYRNFSSGYEEECARYSMQDAILNAFNEYITENQQAQQQ